MSLIKTKVLDYEDKGLTSNIRDMDMDLEGVFEKLDEGKKDAVRDTLSQAGLTGVISVETHTDAQEILIRWEDEATTDIERLALVEVYGALNEMARQEDELPTTQVRSMDDLMGPLEQAVHGS